MEGSASDQDLRLAPAHEAILGGPDSSQAETRKLPTDAAFDDADDMYAGLDLAGFPQGTTDPTNGAYKPEQTSSKVQELPVMIEDPAPSALLQHAMQMVFSAEEEERSLIAESAAAYTQLAEAQATLKKQQVAFKGYCCLPEMQSKQWYWIEKGKQNGPYSVADLYRMTQVEQTVSANQEIHNYYEEVSTHIKYKLTEHKGLTSAWQQQQHAAAAVQAAEAAVLASLNEVKAGKGHTAAAKAALVAVQATEACWDWTPSQLPADPSSDPDSGQGYTPSELKEHIATGRLLGSAHVFPISQAGVPRQAAEVVSAWEGALAYCQRLAAGNGQDAAQPTAAAAPTAAGAPSTAGGLDPAEACWAYWDGQQQQGPFPLQDLQAWVHQGHFIASMQVYHITDPTTAYTLEQLFAQQSPPPLPVTSSHQQLPTLTSSDMAVPEAAQSSGRRQHLPHQTNTSLDQLPGYSTQSMHHAHQANLSSPSSNHITGPTHPPAQKHWQQQDLTAQAEGIAEQLRQELQESAKRAVYQIVMKNLREALPGIQQQARVAREAAAAKEAAEAEFLQAEAEAAAQLAAEQAAAEEARLRAEAAARAAAAELARQRRLAEERAEWERQELQAQQAAQAAAAAERLKRELAREEAKRRREEEEKQRQAAAARAAEEAEAARQAEAAAQQAWQEEHLKRKQAAADKAATEAAAAAAAAADLVAAKKAAAEKAAAERAEAKKAAAAKAAAESEAKAAAKKAAADKAAAEKAAAKKAAAEKAREAAEKRAAEEAAAEAAAQAAAERQAAEEQVAAEQVRALAAKMAAEKQAQQAAEAAAQAERQAALKAKRQATAAAMQKQRLANLAAEKERQAQAKEKANQTRLRKAAEKAAAKAASDAQTAAGQAEHHQQHACNGNAADTDSGQKHASGAALHAHRHIHGPYSTHSNSMTGLDMQDARGDLGHGMVHLAKQQQRADAHGKEPSPMGSDVDIMPSPESLTNGRDKSHGQVTGQLESIGQLLDADVDIMHIQDQFNHDLHTASKAGSAGLGNSMIHPSRAGLHQASNGDLHQQQLRSAAVAAATTAGVPEDFDWAAWQDDIGSGIAERLGTRERRAPKRPYSFEEEPSKPPKGKKTGHKMHHHKGGPKHARDPGPAVSSQLITQPKKEPLKRRKVQAHQEAGCIRAVAYQSDAFLDARMDAFQQQGLSLGNVPAAAGDSHQGAPRTVRVVGGKQRQQRSAVRDISRQEAVTDASWGLLKGRTQDLRFGRSRVHAWGLFAKQDIEPEQFMIEYMGETIRTSLLDLREKAYERSGQGSSYLFRVDENWAVDATRQGGLARFINHSCDPNCYTKIITVEGHKHIVIYSKHHIHAGEELTYDYKFEYELTAEPIKCTCGASNCRGRLN